MSIRRLDHVNLRTRDLAAMRGFYGDTLGLAITARNSHLRRGLSVEVEGVAMLHVIEAAEATASANPQIEHFAFTGKGLAEFMRRLDARGVAYNLSRNDGDGVVSVNLRDPDDNRLHVDFPLEEWKPALRPARVSDR